MKTLIAAMFISLVSSAIAGTDPAKVDGIDIARAGNLSTKVAEFFAANHKIECDFNELAKFEAFKISSASSNEEKVPTTPYNYSAKYLVVQKCLSGSTFAGAYTDTVKSAIVTGSFNASYNRRGGPVEMLNLEIKHVKDIAVDSL
jgi:hypothetical protein